MLDAPDSTSRAGEGGPGDRPALSRCTAVHPDQFAATVWGREPSLSRAAELPQGFDDLFSLDAADHVLSRQGLRTPFLRVAKDGATLAAARFTASGGVGAGVADQVSDTSLTRLFADGSTVVLQALHRTHAPLIAFAQRLGGDLGHPVQVNAYVTPPQAQGFSAHYDVHDVFVLQIAGRKRWLIHRPVLTHPLRDQPWTDRRAEVEAAARDEPLLDVVLEPGDALYLPRGFLHAATALGETSAHLTVGIHVWTRRHLLERLLAAADDVAELRAPLPLGIDVGDPRAIAAELAETARLLADALPVDVERVAGELGNEALAAARPAPVAPFAQAAAAASATTTTRLAWRDGLRLVVRRRGTELSLRTQDGTVRLPAAAEAVVQALHEGKVLSVAELPGADDESRLALARLLMRECLVVPARSDADPGPALGSA